MKHKLLVVILALSLVGAFSNSGAAQILGYNLDKAEKAFKEPSRKQVGSPVVAFDALIARPIGLGLTIAGTAVFIATLPFSIPSQSVGNAAHGLIVVPGGYTFVRPLGRGDPRFEEPGIFGR